MIYHDVTTEQLTRIIVDAVKQELNREPLVPTGISVPAATYICPRATWTRFSEQGTS